MSLLVWPLAAMAGGLLGTVAHETLHLVVAALLGRVDDVGWQGGLGGGPYVDFETVGRWRSEAVRKAPLAVGVVAGIVVASTWRWTAISVAGLGVVWGLLWSSPEDLFADAAARPEVGA